MSSEGDTLACRIVQLQRAKLNPEFCRIAGREGTSASGEEICRVAPPKDEFIAQWRATCPGAWYSDSYFATAGIAEGLPGATTGDSYQCRITALVKAHQAGAAEVVSQRCAEASEYPPAACVNTYSTFCDRFDATCGGRAEAGPWGADGATCRAQVVKLIPGAIESGAFNAAVDSTTQTLGCRLFYLQQAEAHARASRVADVGAACLAAS